MITSGREEGSLDILYLIDQIERLVGDGLAVPFSGRVMVDREQLLEVVDQMRVSLPEEILQAHDILQDREELLAQAREEVERVISEAQEKLRVQMQDSELVKASEERARDLLVTAREQAEQILEAAKREAQEHQREVDKYVLEALRQLEAQLLSHLNTVRGGIKVLEEEQTVSQSPEATGKSQL